MTKEEIYFYSFIGISLLYLLLVFFIRPLIRSFKLKRKGKEGEKNIEKSLKSLSLPHSRILKNCYIPTTPGNTTEVDLIMICEQGIFVFESKNYNGNIRGREYEENWTQELNSDAYRPTTHLFYNPVWQNETYVNALGHLLKRPNIPIFSIVVFSNNCNLDVPAVCRKTRVLQLFALKKTMKHVCKENGVVLNSKEINELYNILKSYTKVSLNTKREHIKNINRIYGKKKYSDALIE